MKMNRRDALKSAGVALIGLSPLAALAEGKGKGKGGAPAAAGALPFVKVGEGMAKSVNYVEQGPDAAKHCEKCILYTADGAGAGKCTLFPGHLVKAVGSCNSFAKKG